MGSIKIITKKMNVELLLEQTDDREWKVVDMIGSEVAGVPLCNIYTKVNGFIQQAALCALALSA